MTSIKKTLTAGLAATALLGATFAAPSQANALAAWVVPVIIAAGVGGVAVGGVAGSAAAQQRYAYEPGYTGNVYVQPTAQCRIVREQTPNGAWRRVRVCD
jgi:hypothetical protein